MAKIYGIYHFYEVDGGFGDAIPKSDLIHLVSDRDVADEYVRRYSHEEVYDSPYADLHRGRLEVRELELDSLDLNVAPKLNIGWYDDVYV